MKKRYSIYAAFAILSLSGGCVSEGDDGPEAEGVAMEVSGEVVSATRAVNEDTFEQGAEIGIIPLKAEDVTLPTGTYPLADRVNCKYYYDENEAKFLPDDNTEKIIFKDASPFRMRAYYPYSGNLGTAPEITVNTGVTNQTLEKQNSTLDILIGNGMLENGTYGAIYNMYNNKVNMVFSHRMAKLVLKVNISSEGGFNSQEANDMFDNAIFTIAGLKHEATYNPTTDVMTVPSTAVEADLEFTAENNIAGSYDNRIRTYVFLLIPQSTPTFTFGLSYTDANSVEMQFKTKPVTLNLERGESTVIPMLVTKQAIEIGDADIIDWSQGTNKNDLNGY